MTPPRSGPWADKARFGLVLGLIAACFLWGGGSRGDIPGLILLQPLAILIAAAIVVIPGEMRWGVVRVPLLLLAMLGGLMAVQLIPLPPALWSAVPGHEQFLPFMSAAGGEAPWRPLSLTPDATLASLVGLAIPAAALVGFAGLPEDRTHRLLPYLLAAAALSAVVGLLQLLGGPQSPFYRYAVTNEGTAVGLFANRNHQALFLAMTWPALALWASRSGLSSQQRTLRRWIAGASALALIPMIMVTGSRAGLVLALVGMGCGWALLRFEGRASPSRPGLPSWLGRAGPALALIAVIAIAGLAFGLSRDEAIQRLFATNVSEESRLAQLPVLIRIAGDFLPFGTGFGSFDPVFRYYEPDSLLDPTYLNHAHNDLIELIIVGGLPALALLLGFMAWTARRALVLRNRSSRTSRESFGLMAVAMIVLALLSSLVDYPLRTPIHQLLFAFSSGWLAYLDAGRRPASPG